MSEGARPEDHFWVRPEMRGIFPKGGFRISKSLRKRLKKPVTLRVNEDFKGTMRRCAQGRETWISDLIIDAFSELNLLGYAVSIESYDASNQRLGGLYGVTLGGAFFGESMYSAARDGSKITLAYLLSALDRAGYHFVDCQFWTAHLGSLGCIEVSAEDYDRLLADALETPCAFPTQSLECTALSVSPET